MSFARVAGAIVLLGLAVSGCKQTRLAGPQDGGPICEEGERLVAGKCRFVCERDGHCPEGQRCNLFVGMCEPKPPAPDAGPIVTPCTTGADRCTANGKAVETCGADSTWTVSQTCPVPNGFCKNEKCLSCQPGAAACVPAVDGGASSTQVSVCRDDGSGLRTVTCAGAASCTQGECRECTPGSTRCSADSKSLQTCQKQSDETLTWKWANTGDNLDGTCITQVCELNTTTTMPQCKPPACIPGATSCLNVSTQQVCSSIGAFNPVSCTVYPDGGSDPAGECQNGTCVHECEQAVAAKSYFGCEYWTSVQDNNVDKLFKGGVTTGQGAVGQLSNFAFVVTNRSTFPASVTVSRFYAGAVQTVSSVMVPGKNDPTTKGLLTIYVPWQSIGPASNPVGTASTGQARYAYKITSTRPITVYQFNPLDAVKYTKACTGTAGQPDCSCNEVGTVSPLCSIFGDPNAGVCANAPGGGKKCSYNTYSNDASLLLPAHDLGTSHVGISQEHTYFTTNSSDAGPIAGDSNGYLTIVGTIDGTTVTVKSSAATLAGGGVAAMSKGETRNFILNSYDVLQLATTNLGQGNNIECAANPFGGANLICRVDNDLTGTVITSTSPVALFGGAACTTRPYDRIACDHIEEQIFPFTTWGKTFVAQRSAPLRQVNGAFAYKARDHWKIVASCSSTSAGSPCPNGTTITFSTPPSAADVLPPNRCLAGTSLAANNCRLAGASYMEFKSGANFTVTANFPAALVQMFPGQGTTLGLGTDPDQGDPSMVLIPPAEQWRASYTVLAAPGIRDNYLGLSIDINKVASIEVDGAAVPLNTFTPIANSPFTVKNHPVSVGTHTINVVAKAGISPLPGAGVTVFGYDSYVSYGYTGGLDLTTIVSGINPGG